MAKIEKARISDVTRMHELINYFAGVMRCWPAR